MHATRAEALLKSVEALIQGRRLTLMDWARSWPEAVKVRAPLKSLDRLLSNGHLQRERVPMYAEMAQWLWVRPQPVIIVDWSPATMNKRWQLLRAAVPVGGRTITVLEHVVAMDQLASPVIEKAFLQALSAIVPAHCTPIIVTDAGFRAPWFRAVEALDWHWVGRLRHRTQVKSIDAPDEKDQWVACKTLYPLARETPHELPPMLMVASDPIACRLVVYGKPPKGRKHQRLDGKAARRSKHSRQNARREAEPWLIVASPTLKLSARQLIAIYTRRMQIELSFRDLKSHRYGQGFEDSLTRKPHRLEILLLIHAMANFAAWLGGRACETSGLDQWLSPRKSTRRLYSLVRLGREALVRHWPAGKLSELMAALTHPPTELLDQMGESA
jgi:hypothetical protein